GAAGALFLSLLVLIDEGDEVLIPDPYFPLYVFLVRLCGGNPICIDTYKNGFKLVPEDILNCGSKRVKILIFNNPVNPTGVAYSEAEIKALAQALNKRGLFVVSDEVYNSFIYDFEHVPMIRYVRENIIHIGGFSKTLGIPGWRLGYAISDEETVSYMTTFQQFTYTCPNSVAQKACIKGLEDNNIIEKAIKDDFSFKRDMAYTILSEKFKVVRPQGAFYIYPQAPNNNTDEFISKALEQNVIIVPGKTFSQKNTHFRISYSIDNKKLEEGLKKLVSVV
ncbi:MAG: aminotransferase class I/II-fold pyridoxal phosphate-dependent enzyme, partial [Planctomycetes bacterium]|nr:aminotransferase class I/II-fold pyridoxal phosphate-dependent enzyme [Planctomycetota bacterium]